MRNFSTCMNSRDPELWPFRLSVHMNLKTIYTIHLLNYCLSRLEGLSINNCTASFATHKSRTRRSKIAIFQLWIYWLLIFPACPWTIILFLAPPYKVTPSKCTCGDLSTFYYIFRSRISINTRTKKSFSTCTVNKYR